MPATAMVGRDAPCIVATTFLVKAFREFLDWFALPKSRAVDQDQFAAAWCRRVKGFQRHAQTPPITSIVSPS